MFTKRTCFEMQVCPKICLKSCKYIFTDSPVKQHSQAQVYLSSKTSSQQGVFTSKTLTHIYMSTSKTKCRHIFQVVSQVTKMCSQVALKIVFQSTGSHNCDPLKCCLKQETSCKKRNSLSYNNQRAKYKLSYDFQQKFTLKK